MKVRLSIKMLMILPLAASLGCEARLEITVRDGLEKVAEGSTDYDQEGEVSSVPSSGSASDEIPPTGDGTAQGPTVPSEATLVVNEPSGGGINVLKGGGFDITFSMQDVEEGATAAIYYGGTAGGCGQGLVDWTMIANNLEVDTHVSYRWSTAQIPPGSYHVCVEISQNSSGSLYATSPGTLTISPSIPFETTWKTNNPGVSATNQIRLPLVEEGSYNFTVDWGDGTTDLIDSWEAVHTYDEPGTYSVTLMGSINGWSFNNEGDREKILEIYQWGSLNLGNSGGYFYGATNLVISAIDIPDLSQTTDWTRMFAGCSTIVTIPNINTWNTSHVTTMNRMFQRAHKFNDDISDWDTSSVTDMGFMFFEAREFNQDISEWDTANVTALNYMFYQAYEFNQDIGDWQTGSVTNMAYTFMMSNFNRDISKWDTSNVTTTQGMFRTNPLFDQNISSWNTENVTDMHSMFQDAAAFNQPIGSWSTGNVTNMFNMFWGASAFNYPLNAWDVSNVTNMQAMFYLAVEFNQDLNSWSTGNVNTMRTMFRQATNFNGNITSWDTSNVTNMSNMFTLASAFNQDLNAWDTSNVTTMAGMFQSAINFNGNITTWDTGNVTTMATMFQSASAFNQPIGSWNTSKVTTMNSMIRSAAAFNQDISSWDISSVTVMTHMFNGTTLSTPIFDALLISWSKASPASNVAFHAGAATRHSGGAAAAARSVLVSTYGWTITGGGLSTVWPTSGVFELSSDVDNTSLTLNWGTGSDPFEAFADLEYMVCSGPDLLSIDTVDKCLAGNTVMTWTPATTSFEVIGLDPDTTYHFNVIMRNTSDQKVVYEGLTVATLE